MQSFDEAQLTSIRALHQRIEGTVLLLCSGSGRIVFVFGDPSVFEIKLTKLIQRNVFSLGFSLRSRMEVARDYPEGLLTTPRRQTTLNMELISRSQVLSKRAEEWELSKQFLMKGLNLNCSVMKVSFSERTMMHKMSEVYKVSQSEMSDEMDGLVLIEVKVAEQHEISTPQVDYEYVRAQVLKEMELDEFP